MGDNEDMGNTEVNALESTENNEPVGGPDNPENDVNLSDQPNEPEPEGGEEAPEPTEEPMVDLGGEKFTASQIQEALEIQKNQSNFTKKNQDEAERLNTLARVLEGRRQESINQPVETPRQPQPTQQKTSEEIRDLLLGDNPSEAMAYFDQLVEKRINEATNQTEAKGAFMTAYPDFKAVVNSKEFGNFMDSNPLGVHLNDVNGYFAYKLANTGDDLKNAENNGFQKGEKNVLANQKAKSNLKIIGGAGGVTIPTKQPITNNTPREQVMKEAVDALIAGRANTS